MLKNEIIIDGKIQKDIKVFNDVVNFNISVITGQYKLIDNTFKNRYTYIRVIYTGEVSDELKEILQKGTMVRIYGKLDSEQYVSKSDKVVYNKILNAKEIKKIRYVRETNDYEEV